MASLSERTDVLVVMAYAPEGENAEPCTKCGEAVAAGAAPDLPICPRCDEMRKEMKVASASFGFVFGA